jgi:hypothetical protein
MASCAAVTALTAIPSVLFPACLSTAPSAYRREERAEPVVLPVWPVRLQVISPSRPEAQAPSSGHTGLPRLRTRGSAQIPSVVGANRL